MAGMDRELTAELDSVAEESRRRVEGLLRETGHREEVLALKSRSVAVASGKGGVGKTITAVNLALHFAQAGERVALIDLDPLSDAASLLDLAEAESALTAERLAADDRQLADYTLKVFRNLDLLFPAPKLGKGESLLLLELIYRRFAAELARAYDLAIFDLPAGAGYEENLAFLPFMDNLILVTNPEPTAHAAAGTYLHRLFSLYPVRDVHLWHNRFVPEAPPGFNPTDVAGNYNRNVPEELRLAPEQSARLADLAFVPEDPALNLLRGEPAVRRSALRFLLDTLHFLLEQHVSRLAAEVNLADSLKPLLVSYLCRHRRLDEPEAYLDRLGEYLATLAGSTVSDSPSAAAGTSSTRAVFSPEERRSCLELLQRARRDALRLALAKVIRLLEDSLQIRGLPKGLIGEPGERSLDHELGRLLVALNRLASRQRALVNPGGVLLFYFALYKLLRSDTVVRLIAALVPRRRNSRGQAVRDRYRQIRSLVEQDPAYRARYLKLVRLLAPVVFRQVATVVKALGLERLLFRDPAGGPLRGAYLKLLTNFLHDTAYSGLSVVVGFPYRSAAAAFRQGAERLRSSLSSG
jgi:flagellar biosynthesis protein FlhG